MNREQEPQGLGPEAHDSPRSSHIGFGSVQMIMNITRAADSAEEPQPSGALIQELLLELTHLVQHLQQDCSSTPGAPDNGTPGSSSSSNSNLSSTSCSDWVSSLRIRLAQVDQQLLAAPGWEQHPDALMTQQRVLVELQQAVQLLSPPRLHPQEQQEPPAWIMLPPCLPLATMEQPTPAAAAAPAAVGAAEGTEGAQQQQQGGRCGAAATAGPCAKETQVMVYCGNAREAQLGSSVRTVVQRSGELVLDTGADVQAATMHPDGPVCGVIRLAIPKEAQQQSSLLSVHLLQPAPGTAAPEHQQQGAAGSPDSQPTASQAMPDSADSADSTATLHAHAHRSSGSTQGVPSAAVPAGTLLASVPLLVLPEPCCAEVLSLAADMAAQGSRSMCRDLGGFMRDVGLLLDLRSAEPGRALGSSSSSSSSHHAAVEKVRQHMGALLLKRGMLHCCALLGIPPGSSMDTVAADLAVQSIEQLHKPPAASVAGSSVRRAAEVGPAQQLQDDDEVVEVASSSWQQEARVLSDLPSEVTLSLVLRGYAQPHVEAAYRDFHALAQAHNDMLAALVTGALIPMTHLRIWQEGGAHICFLWGLAMYTVCFTLPFWLLLATGPAWRARYRAVWLLCSQLLCYLWMGTLLVSWIPRPQWLLNFWSAPLVPLLNGGFFAPVTVQLPFRQAAVMNLVHSFSVDVLAVGQLHGWARGVVMGCMVALCSCGVAAALDWRCRVRFAASALKPAAVGKCSR